MAVPSITWLDLMVGWLMQLTGVPATRPAIALASAASPALLSRCAAIAGMDTPIRAAPRRRVDERIVILLFGLNGIGDGAWRHGFPAKLSYGQEPLPKRADPMMDALPGP